MKRCRKFGATSATTLGIGTKFNLRPGSGQIRDRETNLS